MNGPGDIWAVVHAGAQCNEFHDGCLHEVIRIFLGARFCGLNEVVLGFVEDLPKICIDPVVSRLGDVLGSDFEFNQSGTALPHVTKAIMVGIGVAVIGADIRRGPAVVEIHVKFIAGQICSHHL